jgi:hypothetical protein
MDFQSIALPSELRHQPCYLKRGKGKSALPEHPNFFKIFSKIIPGGIQPLDFFDSRFQKLGRQLEGCRNRLGLGIERDRFFTPCHFSELKK